MKVTQFDLCNLSKHFPRYFVFVLENYEVASLIHSHWWQNQNRELSTGTNTKIESKMSISFAKLYYNADYS